MGLTKNRENFDFLCKNSPKGQIPLSNFYKIKGGGGVSQVRTLTPNFTVVTLKIWAYSVFYCQSSQCTYVSYWRWFSRWWNYTYRVAMSPWWNQTRLGRTTCRQQQQQRHLGFTSAKHGDLWPSHIQEKSPKSTFLCFVVPGGIESRRKWPGVILTLLLPHTNVLLTRLTPYGTGL